MNQSKTEETKINYINRSKQIMIRAYNESIDVDKEIDKKTEIINYNGQQKISLNLINTVVWSVKKLSPTLMQSSWKLYRNSLIYYAEIEFEKGKINEKQLDKIKELLRRTRSDITKKTGRTSSVKKKSFNLKEMKRIDLELKNSRSKWSNPTRIFIRAGKYTGLRPSEWKSAIFIKEKNILVVKNAKNTNGRSFGEERKLSLNHLEKDQIKDIELHMVIVNKMIELELWDSYYNGCSNLLKRASRRIWKNKKTYPTLYSCRHQFAADMKASGCTKREVAALMGHASDKTAESHYGKKIHGTKSRKPIINKADVRLVKNSSKEKFKFE